MWRCRRHSQIDFRLFVRTQRRTVPRIEFPSRSFLSRNIHLIKYLAAEKILSSGRVAARIPAILNQHTQSTSRLVRNSKWHFQATAPHRRYRVLYISVSLFLSSSGTAKVRVLTDLRIATLPKLDLISNQKNVIPISSHQLGDCYRNQDLSGEPRASSPINRVTPKYQVCVVIISSTVLIPENQKHERRPCGRLGRSSFCMLEYLNVI